MDELDQSPLVSSSSSGPARPQQPQFNYQFVLDDEKEEEEEEEEEDEDEDFDEQLEVMERKPAGRGEALRGRRPSTWPAQPRGPQPAWGRRAPAADCGAGPDRDPLTQGGMCGSTKAARRSRCGSPAEECQPGVLHGRGLATAVTWGFSEGNGRVRRSTGLWSGGRHPQQSPCCPTRALLGLIRELTRMTNACMRIASVLWLHFSLIHSTRADLRPLKQ
uniref:Uncharacterized protein n=1 Tax=Ficedula albicollis TaxID=59894 RepID=A0A803VZ06_FICAL